MSNEKLDKMTDDEKLDKMTDEELNKIKELCDEILRKLGALDAANERLDNDLSYSDLPDINWRSFLSWFTTVKYKKD